MWYPEKRKGRLVPTHACISCKVSWYCRLLSLCIYLLDGCWMGFGEQHGTLSKRHGPVDLSARPTPHRGGHRGRDGGGGQETGNSVGWGNYPETVWPITFNATMTTSKSISSSRLLLLCRCPPAVTWSALRQDGFQMAVFLTFNLFAWFIHIWIKHKRLLNMQDYGIYIYGWHNMGIKSVALRNSDCRLWNTRNRSAVANWKEIKSTKKSV